MFIRISLKAIALCPWFTLWCMNIQNRMSEIARIRKYYCFVVRTVTLARKIKPLSLWQLPPTLPRGILTLSLQPSRSIQKLSYVLHRICEGESGKNSFRSLVFTTSFLRSWPKTHLPRAKCHLTANDVWEHPGKEQRTSEGRWRPLAVYRGRIDKHNTSLRQKWNKKIQNLYWIKKTVNRTSGYVHYHHQVRTTEFLQRQVPSLQGEGTPRAKS